MSQSHSLVPGRCDCGFKCVNFKHNLGIYILNNHVNITPEWMPEDVVDGKSTLVQIMAWCYQAPSHLLSQCWLISLLPYDITRWKWVKFYHSSQPWFLFLSPGWWWRWRPGGQWRSVAGQHWDESPWLAECIGHSTDEKVGRVGHVAWQALVLLLPWYLVM